MAPRRPWTCDVFRGRYHARPQRPNSAQGVTKIVTRGAHTRPPRPAVDNGLCFSFQGAREARSGSKARASHAGRPRAEYSVLRRCRTRLEDATTHHFDAEPLRPGGRLSHERREAILRQALEVSFVFVFGVPNTDDRVTYLDVVSAGWSRSIAVSHGKPESYVLTSFQKVDAMSFGGDAETPAAFCYLSSLGSIDLETNKKTSAVLAEILEEVRLDDQGAPDPGPSSLRASRPTQELGVPANRYYVNFYDSPRPNCGYNGGTF